MSKLTITLTLDDEEADALIELLRRGMEHTYWAPHLAQQGAPVVEYAARRVDDARILRGRKVRREAK